MHLCDALLNYYADPKHLEKAEAMTQTMKELELVKALSYNWNLTLNSKMGKNEDVEILMQEMEDKGIWCNKNAFKILVNGYAGSSNIEKMEKLLMKMERDSRINWKVRVSAAKGYLKASFTEKTSTMLKRSVWEEWLSMKTWPDILFPNAMISGYSKKGLWEKDEAFVRIIERSGMELNADSFVHLAAGYCVAGQMVKAAESIKKAISKYTRKEAEYQGSICISEMPGRSGSSRRAFQASYEALSFRSSYI
ncbi:PREDICTED: pentatricopeptide repeat-containing protein At2g20710, mitochondrial-like [Populus euphratica]|uniref:Pentatricopeptide repeat-containing protein At2g20710, mitochondrial-like n=1 Tax=Populus euphratica TaxID=75702 RepID=A0AAJ6UY31_POPEU|nr:PREDICTED: pentatricopeptide repeat-containing protein At2g20710, mitochondrial-like [Populus euphratica]